MAKDFKLPVRESIGSNCLRQVRFNTCGEYGSAAGSVVNRSLQYGLRLLALVCLVSYTGCVADRSETAIPDSDEPVVTVASTTQIEILQAALPDSVLIADAYAVRSESHDWAHFVAARLDGVDGDDIGLWLMLDGMDIPGARFSVNTVASDYSQFPMMEGASAQPDRQNREISVLLELVDARRLKQYP
jgi:hypothetical protein